MRYLQRLVYVVVSISSAALARDYHVAQRHPAASDENAGTADAPFLTIAHAASVVQAGDRVVIGSGVYRESVVIETNGTEASPIRFEPAPAARVVVTGADALTEWQKEEGEGAIVSTAWPHRFVTWTKTNAHPSDDRHAMIGRCEQVFVNNYPLLQVLDRAKMSRGTFYVDTEAKRLYLWDRGNRDVAAKGRCLVEASSRSVLWQSKGAYVQVRGIRFRYAANRAQQAAASFRGKGSVIEDCVFEKTNSIGARLGGEDMVIRRCQFLDNGQMGFGAGAAHRTLMTECEVRNNNTKGWNRNWEAGGNKLALCRGLVIEKSRFIGNRGNGIWFDIGNEKCVVRNCLIADNEQAGIFYEISYSLYAHDNVIIGNGFGARFGAWGADGGISLSSSPNCVIERNLLIGNREGFQFREQNRSTPLIDGTKGVKVWNHDNTIRNNVIAYNQNLQVGGWFDVTDGRYWPKTSARRKPAAKGAAPKDDIAAKYKDRDGKTPAPKDLESLSLVLDGNLYAIAAPQGLFQWGCSWRDHAKFTDLAKVASELGLEQKGKVVPFIFADYLTRDFRVPADSPALKMGCYPKGEIPGVKLGTLAK